MTMFVYVYLKKNYEMYVCVMYFDGLLLSVQGFVITKKKNEQEKTK